VGELLGAFGVIITLLYLTSQMRQNTRALRSSAIQTYRTEASAIADFTSQHAEVFAKEARGEELDDAEKIILRTYSQRIFGMMEAVYLGYRDGSIPKEVFDARMSGLKLALKTEHVRRYWRYYFHCCCRVALHDVHAPENALRAEAGRAGIALNAGLGTR
jgi:hypothetical protein